MTDDKIKPAAAADTADQEKVAVAANTADEKKAFIAADTADQEKAAAAAMTDDQKKAAMAAMMKNCKVCPRECGVDRSAGQRGICRAPAEVIAARAALHYWEEPCISGHAGSGAVFFSGCSLGCVYCQNAEISGNRQRKDRHQKAETSGSGQSKDRYQNAEISGNRQSKDRYQKVETFGSGQSKDLYQKVESQDGCGILPGIAVSVEKLSEIFLRLQNEEKANNINLVTASHYIPQVAEALAAARTGGLKIPIIFNSSGYEKVSSLRLLDGLVDVYLPDFKYMSPQTAGKYSHAPDYPGRVKEAIAEMVRQTGEAEFYPENGQTVANNRETLLIRKGVIVRHLLLPGHVSEAKEVVSYLHDTYGDTIYISLMNQYTPMPGMQEDSLLGRTVTKREYRRLIDFALEIGVNHGFIQEGGTAKESFIPAWNGEGVR